MMWRQAHFGAVLSGSLQLPCKSSNETGVEKEVVHSSPRGDPMEVRELCLSDVRGLVHTTCRVTIPQFSTVSVYTNSSVKGHCMWVHCAHGSDARSPVTYSSSTNSDLQRTTPGVLKGTYLSVQLEYPFHGNPHKDCGWVGCHCQPAAPGSPPDKDFWGTQWQTPKGMGLGGPGPPRPQRMAQTGAEAG